MNITINPLVFYFIGLLAAWCLLALFLWRRAALAIAHEIITRIHSQLTGKSWRTTTLGLACMSFGVWELKHEIEMHHWFTVLSVSDTMHYMVLPLLAFAAGWGLLHARDHRAKD